MAEGQDPNCVTCNEEESPNKMVTFQEQGEAAYTHFPSAENALVKALQPSTGSFHQEIRDFLSRPVLTGTYTVSGVSNTVLGATSVDYFWLSTTVANKVAGFQAYNFTIRARITVNADPFLQGRLLLVFVPGDYSGDACVSMRTATLMTATQLPRVEIDLATQKTGILEIPYIYPAPYYQNAASNSNVNSFKRPVYGNFVLMIYGGVATGTGSTSCNAQLFMSAHDVNFNVPGPQMSMRSKTSVNSVKFKSRVVKKDEELDRDDIKPISGALAGLSMVAGAIKNIPMLSSIATPAEWVTNELSKVAKTYGFSNPEQASFTQPMLPTGIVNFNNCDVPVYTQKLSATRSNVLVRTSMLKGNDEDELSILSLVTRPAYYNTFSFSTSTAPNTLLATYSVRPDAFNTTFPIGGTTATGYTPLSFVTQFFDVWRGGIEYHFKFVKTRFHSARLMFVYVPASSTSTAAPNTSDNVLCMRQIVDISDISETKIVVPFVCNELYIKTGFMSGKLYVYLLNELVAPATVSSSVDVLVETCGAPDYEVAVPKRSVGISLTPARAVRPQMGTDDMPEHDLQVDPVLGGSDFLRSTVAPSEFCIGEKINSLRSIMKIPSPVYSTNTTVSLYQVKMDPLSVFTGISVSSGGTTNLNVYNSDMFGVISSCFYMSRGSVNFYTYSPTRDFTNSSSTKSAIYRYNSTVFAQVNGGSAGARTNLVLNVSSSPQTVFTAGLGNTIMPTHEGSTGFTFHNVPFYSTTPWVVTTWNTANSSSTSGETPQAASDMYRTASVLVLGYPSNINVNSGAQGFTMFRAAADDYDVGFFIGVPLFFTNTLQPLNPLVQNP